MNLNTRLPVEIIAERTFDHRLSLPVPAHDDGWLISFQDHPDVVLLDANLNELQRLDLQAQNQQCSSTAVAASRGGQWLVVSARTYLRIFDRLGHCIHDFPHPPWGNFLGSRIFFDHDDRLWYVEAGDKPGANDRLKILDPNSGRIVMEQTIENNLGQFDLFPCPDDEGVLIDVACGQDGSYLYLVRLTGEELTVEQYPFSDRVFCGGFSPNGREFVTGAHDGDAVKVHAFPSGQVVASLESVNIFAAEDLVGDCQDAVGYQAIFLDGDYLLADTDFGRLLLINRPNMQVVGTVWPPGCKLQAYDERGKNTDDPSKILAYETGLSSLHPAGVGRVLTAYHERAIRLLDVSPLLKQMNKDKQIEKLDADLTFQC